MKKIKILIGILLLFITGFALFSQSINIGENSTVTSTWDISITNVETKTVNGNATNQTEPEYNGLTASFDIAFEDIGDYIEYEVTVTNGGNLTAHLNNIVVENANTETVSMTYTGITTGEELIPSQSKTFIVKVLYKGGLGTGTSNISLDYGQENEPNIDSPVIPSESTKRLVYDYSTNGGISADIKEKYYAEGGQVDLNVVAVKSGYEFVGWNSNKDAHQGLSTYEMPETSTTLYAIYKKKLKASYEEIITGTNEKIKVEADCYVYNKGTTCEIELPEAEKREHILLGWYTEAELVNSIGSVGDTYTLTENKTIYPKFREEIATLTLTSTATTKSITVVSNAQSESGIKKYEYSIDGGTTWEYGGTSNVHTFTNLTHQTSYNIVARITTETKKQVEVSKTVTTNTLDIPTFEEVTSGSNVNVTILYPSGCGDTYTCAYKKDNGEWITVTNNPTITFTNDGTIIAQISDGTNYVDSSAYSVVVNIETDFAYSGEAQTYTAPATGYYKIEAWGAQGGTGMVNGVSQNKGGNGGYTSGEIYLSKGNKLYLYVGGKGGNATDSATGGSAGYNGGAQGGNDSNVAATGNEPGGGSGGATDIRTTSGDWDNATSLNSRIMVAGGGGGGSYSAIGGNAGGLIGNKGNSSSTVQATQTLGNEFGKGAAGLAFAGGTGAGGGGYYGSGSGPNSNNSGGGGSSFISGYAGVNAITSSSVRTHTNNTKHYSNKYFINTEMKPGLRTGNGKARITYLGAHPTSEDSTKIMDVRYIKDCINGNSKNNTNHWIEIQAINNGVNVAKNKTVTGTLDAYPDKPFSNIVDGIIDNSSLHGEIRSAGNQCVTVDLGQKYNLEEIRIWHYFSDGRSYNNNTTSISEDNVQYKIVRSNKTEVETENGFVIKSVPPIPVIESPVPGDGLYTDPIEGNRYVYKGANPNNYITFNNEEWRIISIEPDNTIKIIRNETIGNMPFDPGYDTSISGVTNANSTTGTRYSSNSNNYCYVSSTSAYYGCKVWGSSSTMLNELGQSITSMPREIGGTLYNLPATEAYINTYLNNEYYNSLTNSAKGQIATKVWNVGPITFQSGQTLATDIEQEQAYKWSGKIALMNATDYIRASTNAECTSRHTYNTLACYQNSNIHNWMFNNDYQWIMSTYPHSSITTVCYVASDGHITNNRSSKTYSIRPVLHLKSNVHLSGSGAQQDPYIINP